MEVIRGQETIKSVWLRLGWLMVAILLMLIVLFWDPPSSLNPLGHTMLAILVFAMTIWVSGAVGFAESSFYVIAVMGLLVAFTPDPANIHTLLGSRQGIVMALSGFDSDAWLQVTTAFIIASAVKITGLGDRLGLWLISVSGSGPRQMLAGVLLMCYVMELFIPSPTGVAVLMVALLQRVMAICCVDRGSGLAKGMMLMVAYGTAVASVGVLTSSAPAIQTAGLIFETTGRDITWLRWFLYGEPFGLALGLVLYILILLMFPLEKSSFTNQKENIRQQLSLMGPMVGRERRLLVLLLATIMLWTTGGILHGLGSSIVSALAACAIFLPGMGIGDWRKLSGNVDWGILMLYGSSVSLGQWLLKSGAASWVANNTLVALGLHRLPPYLAVIALIAVFGVFALAFSARAAAVAALVPTAIGFAASLSGSFANAAVIALISFYMIQTAAILPMHHPMAMVTYATGNFSAREMGSLGAIFMILQVALIYVFMLTYWKWVGLT